MHGFELAAHEVGHAVVAHILGAEVELISVDPIERNGGMTPAQNFAQDQWREDVVVLLAGEVAQRKVDDRPAASVDARGHSSWAHDSARASSLINSYLTATRTEAELTSDEPFEDLLEVAYRAVHCLLGDAEVWNAVMSVAAELVASGWKLTGDEFRTVVEPLLSERKKQELTNTLKLNEVLR